MPYSHLSEVWFSRCYANAFYCFHCHLRHFHLRIMSFFLLMTSVQSSLLRTFIWEYSARINSKQKIYPGFIQFILKYQVNSINVAVEYLLFFKVTKFVNLFKPTKNINAFCFPLTSFIIYVYSPPHKTEVAFKGNRVQYTRSITFKIFPTQLN